MAVPVYLDFVAPNDLPDITKLRIYEGAVHDGPFTEIEVVTPVGVQGAYLSSYTTVLATNANNWFTIKWENNKGVLTPYAEAVQGGTRSVVAEITSRVLLRDSSANEEVAAQEAEAVVELMYGTSAPNPASVTKQRLSGMTLLTMARMQLVSLAKTSSGGGGWTAGLVSMKSDTTTHTLANVQGLLKEAARLLGLSLSRVVQMSTLEIAGGLSEIVSADISRLQIEIE